MNSNQENKVSMYFKVRLFFSANLNSLAPSVPALTNVVGTFNSKLDQLGLLDQQATESNQGYAAQKQVYRDEMRDRALAVANGVKSYALINGDLNLAGKVSVAKSTLDRMRDVDVLYYCENVVTIATANAAAIVDTGITSTQLNSFAASVATYKLSLPTPADQRGESIAAGLGVDAKISEIDAQLVIMDALLETQRIQQAFLYNKYISARSIDDNAASNAPADRRVNIEPGYTVIYNVPYSASRQFRIRNNSDLPVNYGLSSRPDIIESKVNQLLGKADTSKLSATIANSGDYLVIENKNESNIDIELWITE